MACHAHLSKLLCSVIVLMSVGLVSIVVLIFTDNPNRKGINDLKKAQIVFICITVIVMTSGIFLACVLVCIYRSAVNKIVTLNTEEVEISVDRDTSYLPDDILRIIREYAKSQRV